MLKRLGLAVFALTAIASAQTKTEGQMPPEDRAAFEKAVASYKDGQVSESQASLEELYRKHPLDTGVQIWLGFVYQRTNRPKDAIPLYEKAYAVRKDNLELVNNLGNAYLASGDEDKALAKYAEVQKGDPKLFEPFYNSGTIYLRKKNYPEAINNLKAAAKRKSDDPYVYNNLGVAYEGNKQLPEAAENFAKASDLQPDNVVFSRNAGLTLVRAKKQKEAIPYLERATADSAKADIAAANTLANAYARTGDNASALKTLERVKGNAGKDSSFWFNLGVLRAGNSDLPGAEAAYRRALEINPGDLDSLNNLGILLFKKGRYSESTPIFSKLAGLNQNSVGAQLNLGASAAKAKDMKTAIAAWKAALRLDPSQSAVRLDLANALLEEEDYAGAQFHFRTVLEKDKNNSEALNGAALIYMQEQKYAAAEAALRTSIASDPKFVLAYVNLAIVLERRGQREKAIQTLQQGLKVDPENEALRQNLDRMQRVS
ncbi:tetratricopeptide repeat protein [bacterium]|nr:MAG: tetratricopeptide repeat protein [bacterium]